MNSKLKGLVLLPIIFVAAGCGGGQSTTSTSTSGGPTTGEPTSGTSGTSQSGGRQKGNLDDGLYTNYVDPKSETMESPDLREAAFEAFTPEDKSIGQFKTIADAINAAVDYDVEYNSTVPEEEQVYGSYAMKIEGTKKLFTNHEGFSEENDDQFFYYENGNSLAAYNCWDAANSILDLHNTNLITHQVSGFGTVSRQSWNSYTLLDSFGEEIDDVTAQSWELSSTMDAAVISFPHRLGGITKLDYTIDLSEVKIAPSYDEADPTYAFVGFYAWQDYYVIANGIACDTSTGNWHYFIGTSRDDSFSDVEYGIGECLMTSTLNKEEGYFVPDAKEMNLKIETKVEHDEQFDEDYQVDYLKISMDNGATFERNITDSLVNNYFPGYPLGFENSYAFIAGLDIKNETVSSNYVENTDYFNGSYFTGLKVTEAKGYVPTKEEMSDVKYGYSIEESWRGKWHDLLMANLEDTPDVMDYTILNTAVCANYQGVNNCDVYSFSYTGNPVGANELGTEVSVYQNKIDRLGAMTIEDLLIDQSLYNEVGSWLVEGQTIIKQKHFLVLDFAGYYHAKELIESHAITPAAREVIEAFRAIDDKDYSAFGEIYEGAYAALSEEEKVSVKLSLGTVSFENREGLYLYAKALPVGGENTCYAKYIYVSNEGPDDTTMTMNTKETFDDLLKVLSLVAAGTVWTNSPQGVSNDDPNNGKIKVMNGDNNFWPSMRIVNEVTYLEETVGLLPNFILNLLEIVNYDDFYEGFYYPIFGTTALAIRINHGEVTTLNDLTDDELEFLNEVWTGDYIISDQLVWNWNSGDKFETYFSTRTRGVTMCAGGDGVTLTRVYFATVLDFLAADGYTPKANGWGVEELVIGK